LVKLIDPNEVLPALDSIGFRQAMRSLRRFEESCDTIQDPDEYIKDLVARSGWIWSKPDIIDEDERVAKRVSWLNQFGMLHQPINYAEVADLLDSLKVPHAMVLLRELEVQSHRVENPTEHIKKTIGAAGADDIHVSTVDEGSSLAHHVALLNQSGKLTKPIDFSAIGRDLARLPNEDAMQLLHEVARKGSTVKDPTGYLKFKLKAKLASSGSTLDEITSDDTKIVKRIEWLNDYGGLLQDIDYNRVAAALDTIGIDPAMAVLKELEDKRVSVRDPNSFILAAVKASWKQAASQVPRHSGKPAAVDLGSTSGFVKFLQGSPRVRVPVKAADIGHALQALGSHRALKVMRQMRDKGLGLDDPLAYIQAAAQDFSGVKQEEEDDQGTADEEDDVAKITKRLKWLNQFAGLSRKIKIDDVVGALYCLGLPQTMQILRGLQEKGKGVSDPTWYIKAAVQRANGVQVTSPPPAVPEYDDEEEDAEDALEGREDYEDDEDQDLAAAGVIVDFDDPEGDDDDMVDAAETTASLAQDEMGADCEESTSAGFAWDDTAGLWDTEIPEDNPDASTFGADEFDQLQPGWHQVAAGISSSAADPHDQEQPPAHGAKLHTSRLSNPRASGAQRRVVGSISGATGKLIPSRQALPRKQRQLPQQQQQQQQLAAVKSEGADAGSPDIGAATVPVSASSTRVNLPMSPQEKLVQVRDLAVKHGLQLDQSCLKALARLPIFKVKDLIDDVLLGGRDRRGVHNPSRYLMLGCQKMSGGLGVEQGLAMELGVSLGVALSNDALDELASIPRKESHAIIRELAVNPEACGDPVEFIQTEVLKCRAQLDARPWPPAG